MKTKLSNDQEGRESGSHENTGVGRRGFMLTTTLAAAGAGAAGLFKPFSAEAAPRAVSKQSYGQGPFPAEGMALYSAEGPHRLLKFQRRALGPKDVAIKLEYCGICHSDIHHGREHWRKEPFPLITGHELAGIVVAGLELFPPDWLARTLTDPADPREAVEDAPRQGAQVVVCGYATAGTPLRCRIRLDSSPTPGRRAFAARRCSRGSSRGR